MRDCCLDDVNNPSIPDDLPDQLALKANLDPDELRRMQEYRRIRRLISQLSVPEEGDRLDAITKLSQCGAAAKRAEPNLVGMLENRSNQTLYQFFIFPLRLPSPQTPLPSLSEGL